MSEKMEGKGGSVREDGMKRRQCPRRWKGKEAVSEKVEGKGGSVREEREYSIFSLRRRANWPENFPIYRILESRRERERVG